ncbi:MAG: response regulator [Cyanothece sp. SIO2G6]|nr:response regulator [Cyanothece sp. SIO2G6]
MQGELSEIDIRSILQLIELGQRTGELFVEAYSSQSRPTGIDSFSVGDPYLSSSSPLRSETSASWFVFFVHGRILYSSDNSNNLQRLRDYLQRYDRTHCLDEVSAPAIATINAPEYGHLWSLIENKLLPPQHGKAIVEGMIRETLFDLLGLHQGSFIFETSAPLSPPLVNIEFSALVGDTMKQMQAWKQLHPHIQSPDQCPSIDNHATLRTALKSSTYQTLRQWTENSASIRQLARYLNRDVLSVAKALYPYVRQGIVQMSPPKHLNQNAPNHSQDDQTLTPQAPPRIVCIDDGIACRQTVEAMLQPRGYNVTTIASPLDALKAVFQIKPHLILCDIAMPELNGYELCAMLRKATVFRQIPIVMLTGKDGFIDRVKARMVRADDYLTKPFSDQELFTVVERYIKTDAFVASDTTKTSAHSFLLGNFEISDNSESDFPQS